MVQKSSSIQIPKYAPDPLGHYWDNITTPNAPTVVGNIYTNAMGDFSFYPVIAFGGRILTTASSATSVSPTMIQTHPKYDNTRYSFSGRSYGVGSSAGLVRSVSEIPNLARYSYLEPGYKTSVSCTVNESSLFNIWPMFGSGYKGVPVDYLAVGPLPNSKLGSDTYTRGPFNQTFPAKVAAAIPIVAFSSIVDLVAVTALSANGRNVISIATLGSGSRPNETGPNSNYEFLDKTQLLVSNVRNAYQNTGVKNTNSSNTVVNQMGISEAFQSILDDILLGQSGAQFMLAPNGKQTAEVTAKVHALRIGQNIYIYGIAALNFLLLLVLSIEAARLKLWKYLPHFNYNDPTNLIIAASLGGCTIAEKALKDNYQHERSERAGNLEIQLELRKDKSAALVAAINPTEPESTPLVRIIVNQ
ncbi:hypothetical protein LTR25_009176 [Vermiconidia calcicola]|uniref:Uncharacterized protein n=1 Tax=Vermiconidia calcicola TaxID=1690605 RepID=A0AAV9Q0P9_9PEZI|nr:hypothetical protein LTR25_009176 [Vermiconidia calcicola]